MIGRITSLSIGAKIGLIPAVGIIAFVVHLAFSFVAHEANTDRLQAVRDSLFPLVQHATAASTSLNLVVGKLSDAVSAGDLDMLAQAGANADELRGHLADMLAVAQNKDAVAQAEQDFESYYAKAEAMSRSMIDGTLDFGTMQQRVDAMQAALAASRASLDGIRQESLTLFNEYIGNALSNAESTVVTGLLIAVATLVVLALTSYWIISLITKNLRRVTAALADFATGRGDLSERIESNSHDEIGELVEQFNAFVAHLYTTISQVVATIAPLSDVSRQLDESAHSFESLANGHASTSDSATQAVESLVLGVQEISGNASRAAELAQEVDSTANQGRSAMEDTVTVISGLAQEVEDASRSMGGLKAETDNVASIVEVIRNIAEQTNLLALNAAIEAARAGEQGRGFAVVADEVRTLASRTQESTQQIQEVINQLQTSTAQVVATMEKGMTTVKAGVDNAQTTGAAFTSITDQFAEMSRMNHSIAEATTTQERAVVDIQQIMRDIRERSEMTTESFKNFVQMSGSLTSISEQLRAVSQGFQLKAANDRE